MRLTSFTDYGLRALMLLAANPEQGKSSADLADQLRVSRHHLTKIIQKLAKAGIVMTRRGTGGGVVLARPAEEIRVGQLVRLLEEGQPLVECLGTRISACTLLGNCRLKHRLRAAEARFIEELDQSSLASIAVPHLPVGS